MTDDAAPAARPAADPALARRVVVVAGGTGHVGGYVVRALLDAGARVVVPTRRPAGARGRGLPDHEHLVRVTVRDWEQPGEIAAALDDRGWVADAAVASLGGWWIGTPLVELDPLVWRQVLDDNLTAHFLAARALVPLVAAAGPDADPVHVALNGAAATEPMALSGPVSVAGAGQRMLLDVLRREEPGVRLHEVEVLAAVAGDDRNLDPVAEVGGTAVAAAVLGVLADPGSPAVAAVAGERA
ncbi:NAD-dependent epimerase/dehydratase family protein [Actinotalea solisilvae]|uniref:NAD-dependent epimerase/dehydratase family protein n=1 Tax=Actinotalea solisilvae TaxID=2072922 RepID=UPI0018F1816F|nr:NAD-dependent epimerase/dehydratase family protein [Actinotalea solisilvae]